MPRKAILLNDYLGLTQGEIGQEIDIYDIEEVKCHPEVTQRHIEECANITGSDEMVGFAVSKIDDNGNTRFIQIYPEEVEFVD